MSMSSLFPEIWQKQRQSLDALLLVYVTPYFACFLVYKLTVSHFTSVSYWNSINLIGWSKFIFKPRARVLITKWYRSNQCVVFPLCFTNTCISSKNGQYPMAGCKNQLIMKYCSKFLVYSICQNIFNTYIKKFTIVNILGWISYWEI